MHHKTCAHCNKPFTTKWVRQQYCENTCRRAADLERQRVKTPIWKNCKTCNTRFDAYNPHGGAPRTYCSDGCRATGIRALKRESEARNRDPNRPPKLCAECNAVLEHRRAVRCKPCAKARILAQNRASKVRHPEPKRVRKPMKLTIGEKPTRSYDVRERHKTMKASDLEKFITIKPTGNPLPADPRAALTEALDRFPALRQAFAEIHGIKGGHA